MNISYETVITPNEFGGYDVSCPDLMPHTTWSAADIANAAGLGAYVMAFAVERHIEAGTPLPAASSGHRPAKGGFVLNVTLDLEASKASMPGYVTVAEAADMLHVSTSRVRALARAGRLESRKQGNVWFISLDSLQDRVDHPRRPGRPPQHRLEEERTAA